MGEDNMGRIILFVCFCTLLYSCNGLQNVSILQTSQNLRVEIETTPITGYVGDTVIVYVNIQRIGPWSRSGYNQNMSPFLFIICEEPFHEGDGWISSYILTYPPEVNEAHVDVTILNSYKQYKPTEKLENIPMIQLKLNKTGKYRIAYLVPRTTTASNYKKDGNIRVVYRYLDVINKPSSK